MRKEIIFAIILGVILGLVIAFGVRFANQSRSISPQTSNQDTSISVTPSTSPSPTFQVISPKNNSVSFKDTLQLIGQSQPNTYVAIIWEEDQTIIKTDENGSFSQQISLVGGENTIKLTAFSGNKQTKSTELAVIYTNASITTPTPDQASSSASQIKKNIIKRLEKNLSLSGFSGSITSINNLSLVIKNNQGKLLQIVSDKDTDIVRSGKSIKPEDLSIDEKIIAIGNLDTKDILSARRIVAVKSNPPDSQRQVIIAPLTNLNVKGRTLDIGKFKLDIPKKSDINIEDLQENQVVIAIIETDLQDNTSTILSLQPLLQ